MDHTTLGEIQNRVQFLESYSKLPGLYLAETEGAESQLLLFYPRLMQQMHPRFEGGIHHYRRQGNSVDAYRKDHCNFLPSEDSPNIVEKIRKPQPRALSTYISFQRLKMVYNNNVT